MGILDDAFQQGGGIFDQMTANIVEGVEEAMKGKAQEAAASKERGAAIEQSLSAKDTAQMGSAQDHQKALDWQSEAREAEAERLQAKHLKQEEQMEAGD